MNWSTEIHLAALLFASVPDLAAEFALSDPGPTKASDVYPRSGESVESLKAKAAKDDGTAAFQLWAIYERGGTTNLFEEDVGRDPSEAGKWLEIAAKEGFPYAQYVLGRRLATGADGPVDMTKALFWLKASAEEEMRAENYLGILYYEGIGVQKDFGKAASHFRRGADGGDFYAKYNLAVLYSQGAGVPADRPKAIKYFRQAEDEGWLPSEPDERKAWPSRLVDDAANGKADAQLDLNLRPARQPAEPTRRETRTLDGRIWVAMTLVDSPDSKLFDRENYLSQADAARIEADAARGQVDEVNNLGIMYARGLGVRQDQIKALELFRQAAGQGSSTGAFSAAVMYLTGEGAAKNQDTGIRWLTEAARVADPYPPLNGAPEFNLGVLFARKASKTKDNYDTAVRWFELAADARYKPGFFIGTMLKSSLPYPQALGVLERRARAAEAP